MSDRRGQNSADESSSGNSESNFNALSNNYDVAGDAGDLRLGAGSHSESSNHSAGNLSNLWHPVDISSGSNASSSGLSGDRREVRDGSQQVFKVGSSSGSQQGYPNPGVDLQRPQEISNAGLMFGIQPNAMPLSTPVDGIPSTYEAGSSSHQNGPGVAPSSQNGPGSSASNSEVPLSPSPATNGPSVSGQNSNSPGTLISQFGNFSGGLGVANTPETFAVEIGNDRILLQLRPSLYNDSRFVAIFIQNLMALQQRLENMNGGLTEETIRELLTKWNFEGVTGDTRSDSETCCICIGDYIHGEEIGALNCGHEFHPECIKNWLLIRNTCPICKSKGLGS